jgi:hypothetical protein
MAHDGLGADHTICKTAFIEAMRAQVFADTLAANAGDPAATEKATQAANNMDLPEVQKNFASLGEAVYQILTVHAQTTTSAATDEAFWQWVAGVNTWLAVLAHWQQGVTQAVNAWAAATPVEQALKNAITGLPSPGMPPASAPTSLHGGIA